MTPEEIEYISWTQILVKHFIYWVSVAFIPIGLFLNLLQALVYSRRKFHNTRMGFYFIVTAFFDSFGLVIVFLTFYGYSIDNDTQTVSDLSCKTIAFVGRILLISPSWIKVLVTLDRLAYVIHIRRLEFLQKRRYISLAIFGIVVVIAISSLANLDFFLVQTITPRNATYDNQTNQTSANYSVSYACTSFSTVVLLRDSIAITLRTLVPFILIVSMNVKITWSFFKTKEEFARKLSTNRTFLNRPEISRYRKEYYFLILVIALDVLFAFVLIPISVTLILLDTYAFVPSWTTPTHMAAARVAYFVTFYLSLLPYASGFIMSIVFNRIFRKELFKVASQFKYSCLELKYSIT